jgi:hypothetical protein
MGLKPRFLFNPGCHSKRASAEPLQLLHFSWYGDSEIQASELVGLRHYFEHIGFDPHHLAHRERPVAFVDIVESSKTFGNLITFLCQ